MQFVDSFRIAVAQCAGQEVGLLLVVALQRHPVTRAYDVVQQVLEPTRLDHLPLAVCATGLQALRFRGSTRVPTTGRSGLCRRHDRPARLVIVLASSVATAFIPSVEGWKEAATR